MGPSRTLGRSQIICKACTAAPEEPSNITQTQHQLHVDRQRSNDLPAVLGEWMKSALQMKCGGPQCLRSKMHRQGRGMAAAGGDIGRVRAHLATAQR